MINEKDPQVIAMRKLKMTDEEIEDILNCDKAIDRGEKMDFDLSAEEHKKAMKNANADEHKKAEKKSPTVYNWNTEGKAKKENVTKVELVSALAKFLADTAELGCENVEITNKQGKVEFTVGETSYTFSLTQHRKK